MAGITKSQDLDLNNQGHSTFVRRIIKTLLILGLAVFLFVVILLAVAQFLPSEVQVKIDKVLGEISTKTTETLIGKQDLRNVPTQDFSGIFQKITDTSTDNTDTTTPVFSYNSVNQVVRLNTSGEGESSVSKQIEEQVESAVASLLQDTTDPEILTGLTGLQGPAGEQGPAGPQGPAGETGERGPAGSSSVVTIEVESDENFSATTLSAGTFSTTGNVTVGGTLTIDSFTNVVTECLQVDSAGLISTAGAACGAGSGGVAIGDAITDATANSVLFVDSSGDLAEDNANFNYDDATGYFGLGTVATLPLDIVGTATVGVAYTNAAGHSLMKVDGAVASQAGYYIHKAGTEKVQLGVLNSSDDFTISMAGTPSFTFTAGGSLGIGDQTPAAMLSVGANSEFQVNSSGAIAAATGVTSSGTITLSGLTADRLVATTTGGQLTNTITSANLALSVSDETGSGALVFGTSPTFTTPSLGSATASALTISGLGGGGTQCVQVDNSGVVSATGSACGTGSGTTFDAIGDAAATGQVDNTNYAQTWTWNTITTSNALTLSSSSLTSGSLLNLSVTSGSPASNTQKVLNISTSGAAGNQTTYGGYISNTHSGVGSNNIGLYITATGGASNTALYVLPPSNGYAAIFEQGNVGIGDTTPSAMFTVGSGDLFQVNNNGAITSSTGYNQVNGVMTVASTVNGGTGTSSGFSLTANSLTTGTGANFASSSLSSGSLINIAVTGTAAASNTQKALNITTSGANATSTQTTYGGYFANTHTGTSSTNIALYAAASGGSNNYSLRLARTSENVDFQVDANGYLQLSGNSGVGFKTILNGNLQLPNASNVQGIMDVRSSIYAMAFGVDTGYGWIQPFRNDVSSTYYDLIVNAGGGNLGVGTTTTSAKLTVAGSGRFTSTNTTGVTTGSGLVLSANSLTSGTGLYVASSSLSSGNLVDLQVSGTAAASNTQTALNILTAGANASSAQTTYGAQISNTHTNGTSGTNVGLYLNASGATTANYALLVNSGTVGIGTTTPTSAVDILTNANAGTTSSFIVRSGTGTASYVAIRPFSDNFGAGISFNTSFDGSNNNRVSTSHAAFDIGYSGSSGTLGFGYAASGSNPLTFSSGFALTSTGNFGVGDYSPDAKFTVGSTSQFQIDSNGAVTASAGLATTTADLGNGAAGYVVTLGRNNNGTATGAGSINFQSKGGTAGYVWQDNAGNLRINSSAPSNANDTAGTVIGDQTSTRNTKQDISSYTNYAEALHMVTSAPLHTFRYIKDVQGYGANSPLAKKRIGYIADEVAAEFMWGNSIDQVSVNGILMASVKALDNKIEALQSQVSNIQVPGQANIAGNAPLVLASHLYLSEDSVGQAKILEGAKKVRISFDKPYQCLPIPTVTPNDFIDGSYRVTEIDSYGFTIELQAAQEEDVIFNWHAFAGQAAKLTVSDGSISLLTLQVTDSNDENNQPVIEETPVPEVLGETIDDSTQENTEPDVIEEENLEEESETSPQVSEENNSIINEEGNE